ncbi:hypothetical protein [Flavobacterium macrobrachii]|jgi:hypothetical protein|uniref:hypothetical protein n=1 Tax=Flavobacterium macrobrachii TaxID=591204 RepID=UPI0037BEEDC9
MKKKFLFMMFVSQVFFLSCKKEENQRYVNKKEKKWIEYSLQFPDTVEINKSYTGIIRYESILDTITTDFDDKKNNRYTIFYLTIVNNPLKDNSEKLKKIALKFGADNNRIIPFEDIKFDKVGIYYIDGIIHDFAVIELNKKNESGEDLVRLIENEERVSHKVIVVNRK